MIRTAWCPHCNGVSNADESGCLECRPVLTPEQARVVATCRRNDHEGLRASVEHREAVFVYSETMTAEQRADLQRMTIERCRAESHALRSAMGKAGNRAMHAVRAARKASR